MSVYVLEYTVVQLKEMINQQQQILTMVVDNCKKLADMAEKSKNNFDILDLKYKLLYAEYQLLKDRVEHQEIKHNL
jgi:hypothetical protein